VTSVTHLVKPPVALGFLFDGIDDYVRVPYSTVFDLDYGTLEVLARFTAPVGAEEHLLFYRHIGFMLTRHTDDRLRYYVWREDGTYVAGWTAYVIPLNIEKHYVLTFDGRYAKVYVNYDEYTYTYDFGNYVPMAKGIKQIMIGVDTWGAGYFVPYVVFFARVYNRVLSPEEVSARFNIRKDIMEGCVLKLETLGLVRGGGTKWLDESPYKSHGTVYGAKRVRCCHCNVVRDYGA